MVIFPTIVNTEYCWIAVVIAMISFQVYMVAIFSFAPARFTLLFPSAVTAIPTQLIRLQIVDSKEQCIPSVE
jgi:hypothetical protein